MNPRIILTAVLALGILTLGPVRSYAEKPGGKSAGRPPAKPNKAPEKKEAPAQVHTTIGSISAESISITDAKGEKTYKITKETEVELKGQKVAVDALKPGMRVSVTMASDATVAARINASDAPKEAPSSADKAKK